MNNSTTEQLRHDIDSGRTGDKVRVSDLAAAPLGTDEEAAGTAPDPQAIETARQQERTRPVPAPRRTSVARVAWLLVVIAMAALGLLFAWALGGL
ncbi:MAG: hypothetical protein JO328_00145 [Hyphomicrobiales bacterium]|nr:hypothetical protein [Hyphomicrobiales bacterium]MBV9429778.1 hypothetical protein [Bradyrhizobiaceae bacterium]